MKYYSLLFECDDFIVIDKFSGISVHKDQAESGLTMQLSSDFNRPLFLVHRLDKVTSGVMVFAKHQEAAAQLSALFACHQVQKFYLAISAKKPSKKQGTIKGDMSKSRRGMWKLEKTTLNPAITRFFSCSIGDGLRMFLVKPQTGKTHQIRVALKSIGAPILGDSIYSNDQGADRTYLHAWQISFVFADQFYQFRSDPSYGERFLTDTVERQLAEWAEPNQLCWPGQQERKNV